MTFPNSQTSERFNIPSYMGVRCSDETCSGSVLQYCCEAKHKIFDSEGNRLDPNWNTPIQAECPLEENSGILLFFVCQFSPRRIGS